MRCNKALERGVADFVQEVMAFTDDEESRFGLQGKVRVVDKLDDLIEIGQEDTLCLRDTSYTRFRSQQEWQDLISWRKRFLLLQSCYSSQACIAPNSVAVVAKASSNLPNALSNMPTVVRLRRTLSSE